ncbi:MAG: hypothetical protein Q8S84_05785 [bacterium]|nr:hypothetical protein [bacterium]MDP3380992.1 hypothetical protein [bacterium]
MKKFNSNRILISLSIILNVEISYKIHSTCFLLSIQYLSNLLLISDSENQLRKLKVFFLFLNFILFIIFSKNTLIFLSELISEYNSSMVNVSIFLDILSFSELL